MKIYKWVLGILLLGWMSSCGSLKESGGRQNTTGLQKTAKLHKETKRQKFAAEEMTDPLSPEERRKYEYFFLEALKLKEQGEYDAAFEMYERCLDIAPDEASALYEISQFYLFLKQPAKGQATLEKAVRQAPDNFWYKQTLAAFYQAKGEPERAVDIYEEMVDQFPAREEPLMILVDLYNRAKDYPNVIRALDRLEERAGKSEQISMEKFRIYLTMNNDKKAFDEIENLANEYPNDLRYRIILGDVYLNNGKTKEAYEIYRKVLAEEPDNAMGLLSMASYYQKIGEDSLYRKQLDKVLLNKKVDSETKLNIMRQLIGQSERTDKDSLKIISLFDSMLKQDQEDAQVPMMYASYLISKGMEKESVPVLKKVLEIDPENAAARLQLLSYAFKENDIQEAIKITEPALQYSPEILEFYYYLGMAYYQEERKEDALNVYLKGLEQVTDKSNKLLVSDFYSVIGELYYAKKMKAEAYAAYDSSLVYNPDNVATLNNYAYYLSLEKENLDRAEEMSYKTVKAEPDNETFLDTYAWILFEKGKYAEAKVYIDDAMKNGGGESDVVVEHCGDIYYMNGEKEKALELWRKALEMGSESETLKKKIAERKFIAE